MAFVTLFIFVIWMYQVRLLIALLIGPIFDRVLNPVAGDAPVLLVNNKLLLGRHVNGPRLNVLAVACVGLVIVLDVALLGQAVLGAFGARLLHLFRNRATNMTFTAGVVQW